MAGVPHTILSYITNPFIPQLTKVIVFIILIIIFSITSINIELGNGVEINKMKILIPKIKLSNPVLRAKKHLILNII